jgi:phenylacetate-CoA ligase
MNSVYPVFFDKLLMPAYCRIRSRRMTAHWRDLERSQWESPEAIDARQWEQVRAVVRVALETVPYYAVKYGGIKPEDIRGWADFRRLPMLTRQEVEEHREDLRSSLVPAGRAHLHATGGSSGQPVRFYRTVESYDWRMAATWRTYSWSGYRPGERIAYLWGAPVGTPGNLQKLKTDVFNWFYGQISIPTFTRTEQVLREMHQRLRSYRPAYLAGFTSSLVSYALFLQNTGLEPPAVKAVLTAAEPCQPGQRTLLESVLGAPVFVTYGSREFMSIGGECERHEGIHLASENLVVETDSRPGEAGEILVTDLHNYGTLFLRYRIGDIGIATEASCSCGRGLPRLMSVEGRSGGVIDFADGRQVSGLLFFHVLKEFKRVVQFQAIQQTPSNLTLDLLVAEPLTGEDHKRLLEELKKYLGSNGIEIRQASRLRQSKSGKIPPVVPLGAHSNLV